MRSTSAGVRAWPASVSQRSRALRSPWAEMARAPSSQRMYSSCAPRRPASAASWATWNSPASMRSLPRRVAQPTMALIMTADEALLVDPVVARTAEALEGLAPDQCQSLGPQRPGRLGIDPVGLAVEALERDPVGLDPLDEVTAGAGRVGQVLGADPTAQAGQVVVDGLARDVTPGSTEWPHAECDLVGTAVVRVVQDEVHQELVDWAPAVRCGTPRARRRPRS